MLEEVIRVIEVASNFTLQQGDQENLQTFCNKLSLHHKYHTIKDFAKIHSETTGQDISFGSSLETMIVELFRKEFPFEELKVRESQLSPLDQTSGETIEVEHEPKIHSSPSFINPPEVE